MINLRRQRRSRRNVKRTLRHIIAYYGVRSSVPLKRFSKV